MRKKWPRVLQRDILPEPNNDNVSPFALDGRESARPSASLSTIRPPMVAERRDDT